MLHHLLDKHHHVASEQAGSQDDGDQLRHNCSRSDIVVQSPVCLAGTAAAVLHSVSRIFCTEAAGLAEAVAVQGGQSEETERGVLP